MLAWMLGREIAIILVIALLALGGSQLPKLVRTFGEASATTKQATEDGGSAVHHPERRS